MAEILNGKKIAEKVLMRLKKEISKRNLKLKLVIILVGDNPVSKIFVRQKEKFCKIIGVNFELAQFPSDIKTSALKDNIKKIVANPVVSGVVVQLPLPSKFVGQEIFNLITSKKDIDTLSEKNLGKFYAGDPECLPPVVGAVSYLLNAYKISTRAKDVVLVGAGRLVGYPLSLWFFKKNASVSVVNKFTKDILYYTKKADIIVCGVGLPNMLKYEMVKNGVVIIDAGSGFKNGKIKGDVDFEGVFKKASYITPVPGGVGPLTVACLLENLVKFNK